MSENFYKLVTILRSCRQDYGPIQTELFVPFLSPPCLHSGSSALLLSSLLFTLGYLQAYVHTVRFLPELSFLVLLLLLPFRCSRSRYLCAALFQWHARSLLPSQALIHLVVLVVLCWACATKQPRFFHRACPLIMFHPERRTQGQTNFC